MKTSLKSPSASLLSLVLFRRKRYRALVIGLSLIAACAGLAAPYFQKIFVDHLLGSETRLEFAFLQNLPTASFVALAFIAAIVGQTFHLLSVYFATRESIDIQREISNRMYQRMLSLRTDTLGQRPVGEIVSVFASDVQGASILLEQSLPQLASIFFPLVLAPVAIYSLYHIPLRLTLIVFAVVILLDTFLAVRQSRFFYRFKKLAADRAGLVNEWVQNMRALRILGWVEGFEHKIFQKRIEETDNRIHMVTNGQVMNSVASSITFAINITGLISILLYAPQRVTPGELLALLWIFGIFLTRAFRQMPWFFTMSLDGTSSLRRLQDFLSQTDHGGMTFADEKKHPTLATSEPIRLQGMNLRLQNRSILQDIHLEIQPGEFVAIVGEVGSGKSLLLLSLMGETGATFGTYSIGKQAATAWTREQLRSHFSYVPQEGFVMSASLRENVAFDYDVSTERDKEILASLALAQFDIRSELLAGGLSAEIGERGVNLSGGQRQRVSLARAHFNDRPIVLLDDCLSAVDVDTERALVETLLFGAWKKKTRILVTHRLSVLSRVDRILFLHQGQILDEGTFEALADRSAEFRAFTASVLKAENTGDIVVKTGMPL